MSASNQGPNATKRITCANCGANNYVGGSHCWQCGKPLDRNAKSEAPALSLPDQPSMTAASAPSVVPSYAGPSYVDPPILSASAARSVQPIVLPAERVDPDLATKAAAAMGLIFPIVAIPAGMIFLMLDDARKVRLGWLMIWWSVGGSVVGFILSLLAMAPLMAVLHGLVPHGGGGGGNPLSQLNSPDLSGQ